MIRVTAMNRKRFVGDWAMLGTVFGLILFGLLMIYSASNYTARLHMGNAFYYVERQIFTVLLGTAAMFLMMKLDYHRLLKMALPLYGLSLLLLAAVSLLGENGKVDVRKVRPITFDPFNNTYVALGETVGDAFSAGKSLK